ncbi:hypothetical protein C2S51_013259 [Perilla frutescens var. frutescens]|nr:hypothetical protein C2S51_013259 [Perilla frutescens var. frutescens]
MELGWSKTGRRTRARATCPTPPPDDNARDLLGLESGESATENLPLKKRKLLDSAETMVMNIDGGERERKLHRCNICSRSFSSYQALGGHKAHHSSKDQRVDGDAVVVCGGGAVHRCTFCYKVFSKGQALGGHRRHCQRSTVSENTAKIFTFDLNELPPEWLGS